MKNTQANQERAVSLSFLDSLIGEGRRHNYSLVQDYLSFYITRIGFFILVFFFIK